MKNTQYSAALFATFASLDNLQKNHHGIKYKITFWKIFLMVETFESAYPHQVSLSPVSPLLGLLVSDRHRSRPHGICHCARRRDKKSDGLLPKLKEVLAPELDP